MSDDPDAQAEALYKRSCVACHAADLSGGTCPNLQKVGGRLTPDEIHCILKNGKGMMPSGLVTERGSLGVISKIKRKRLSYSCLNR